VQIHGRVEPALVIDVDRLPAAAVASWSMWSEVRPPTTTQVRDAFGVEVGELRPHPGGFEADAFTDGRWFVKLWRQQPDSDAALALTVELAARGIPVPAAQQARDGSYTCGHHGRRYALFPFVDGRQATWNNADAIARAMRGVHEIADLVLPRTDMDEWCIEVLRGPPRLDLTHLEYARLARSLRDLAVRIVNEVDLEGVNTWGFDGLRRVDNDLLLAQSFCVN
jgi:hypothetical protein